MWLPRTAPHPSTAPHTLPTCATCPMLRLNFILVFFSHYFHLAFCLFLVFFPLLNSLKLHIKNYTQRNAGQEKSVLYFIYIHIYVLSGKLPRDVCFSLKPKAGRRTNGIFIPPKRSPRLNTIFHGVAPKMLVSCGLCGFQVVPTPAPSPPTALHPSLPSPSSCSHTIHGPRGHNCNEKPSFPQFIFRT